MSVNKFMFQHQTNIFDHAQFTKDVMPKNLSSEMYQKTESMLDTIKPHAITEQIIDSNRIFSNRLNEQMNGIFNLFVALFSSKPLDLNSKAILTNAFTILKKYPTSDLLFPTSQYIHPEQLVKPSICAFPFDFLDTRKINSENSCFNNNPIETASQLFPKLFNLDHSQRKTNQVNGNKKYHKKLISNCSVDAQNLEMKNYGKKIKNRNIIFKQNQTAMLHNRKLSVFRRGDHVKLSNGSIRKIECLQFSDFLQSWVTSQQPNKSIPSTGLYWATVDCLKYVQSSLNTAKKLTIRFRIKYSRNSNLMFLGGPYVNNNADTTPITNNLNYMFEYTCDPQQPFFVKNCGWSAMEYHPGRSINKEFANRKLCIEDVCLVLMADDSSQNNTINTSLIPPKRTHKLNNSSVYPIKKQSIDFSNMQPSLPLNEQYVNNINSNNIIHNQNTRHELPSSDVNTNIKLNPSGMVPNYFSVDALAKSPFERI